MDDKDQKVKFIAWAMRVSTGQPFFDDKERDPYCLQVYNVNFSRCFNCDDVAVWIGDNIVYPDTSNVASANRDMPDDVKRDFDEAASILPKSPRGAAALLRLAIQKVCVFLGGSGKNLNDDIALLVTKGLDVRIQQALDVVRVIGNNAVHPGELNIKDDRSTADQLFGMINLIVDVMISQPKHVAQMYEALPPQARSAVEKRDKSFKTN